MKQDAIVLLIDETWPEGLDEAVLEYYGEFAYRGSAPDGRAAICVNVRAKKISEAFDDLVARP